MDDRLKLKYFKYYREHCFYKKLDVDELENLARESLQKGFDDIYAFTMTLLCRYSIENLQKERFLKYLTELRIIATEKGGFPAVHTHLNEGYFQMMVEQNYDNAIKSFNLAKDIYEKNAQNNQPTIYFILQYLGVSYQRNSEDIKAYLYFTEALKCKLNKVFRFHKAMTYNWLAIIEDKHNLSYKALQKALRSAKILKNYSIEIRYCDVLNTIGLLYLKLDKFTEAEITFLESIDIAKKHNLSFIIADAYNNLGMLYQTNNQIPNSIENYQKSLKFRNKETEQQKFSFTLMNLGHSYRISGDYTKAKKYILKAIEITKNFNNDVHLNRCYSNLSLVYLGLKDFKNTKKYLKLSKTLTQKINDTEGLMYVYNYSIELYKEMGDIQKMKEYENLADQTQKELSEIKMNTTKEFLEWKVRK